jgi:2,4-dienoyl-CoA reductase [(3E)-enoyl-CoA-producing], peroxisomal
MPLQSHVSVAKAGVDALAHAIAIEQGPLGVTSNIIAPGPIGGTEGMQRLSRSQSREESQSRIPSGRWGTVKEIADATVYLFSDAGNYVNGENLVGKWTHRNLPKATMRSPTFQPRGSVRTLRPKRIVQYPKAPTRRWWCWSAVYRSRSDLSWPSSRRTLNRSTQC